MRKGYYKFSIKPVWSFLKFKKKYKGFSGYYHNNLALFDNFTILIFLSLILLVISFFRSNQILLSTSLALIVFILYYFFKIKNSLYGLSVQREFKKTSLERDVLEIEYKIYNPTPFHIKHITIEDYFNGSEEFIKFELEGLPAHSLSIKKKRVVLNMGMGEKKFHHLKLSFSDTLNLFSSFLEYFKEEQMMVLPKIEHYPIEEIRANSTSLNGGKFNLNKRGCSVNFIGTKEYIQGEPIKRVNWKLSLKEHKLILNEYERDTNGDLLLIVDLDKVKQFGRGEYSTWEYIKDICLSISHFELANGHNVSLLSQDFHLPYNCGNAQLESIEYIITNAHLSKRSELRFPIYDVASPDSTIYFITTFVQALRSKGIIKDLEILSMNHNVQIVFVDPFDYYLENSTHESIHMLKSLKEITYTKLVPQLEELSFERFQYKIVKIDALKA